MWAIGESSGPGDAGPGSDRGHRRLGTERTDRGGARGLTRNNLALVGGTAVFGYLGVRTFRNRVVK